MECNIRTQKIENYQSMNDAKFLDEESDNIEINKETSVLKPVLAINKSSNQRGVKKLKTVCMEQTTNNDTKSTRLPQSESSDRGKKTSSEKFKKFSFISSLFI